MPRYNNVALYFNLANGEALSDAQRDSLQFALAEAVEHAGLVVSQVEWEADKPTDTELLATLDGWTEVDTSDESPLDPELSGYAASAALKQLLYNWRDAVTQGGELRPLLDDIERVIQQLRSFKRAAVTLVEP